MTRGKNYPYNIQETLGVYNPSYTLRMYPIRSRRSTPFLNCTSTKLKSRIRIKFVAEMLQGIELHAGWCVLILSTALKMNTPDIQQDEYSSTTSQWKLG